MKKQIFVDDAHDYDYEEVDGTHTLYYSNGEQWNNFVKGDIAMTIDDDGNGLIVEFNENGRIDYSEAEKLFILLKLINQPTKYEISTKQPL